MYILNSTTKKTSLSFICALYFSTTISAGAYFNLEDFNSQEHVGQYNSLPAVESNNELLSEHPQFQPFLKEAGEIVTSHGLEADIGLRLIHRHYPLGENQVMAEKYEIVDGVPSLVTSPHDLTEARELETKPASWIFSKNAPHSASLFETSSDPAPSCRRGTR